MELGQLIDIVMGNIFQKDFEQFGELGPKYMSFFAYQSTMINQKLTLNKIFAISLFWKCAMRLITKNEIYYKTSTENYQAIFSAVLSK